jgi:hypothetical protein
VQLSARAAPIAIAWKGKFRNKVGCLGSTATATEDDHTVRKWTGFTRVYGGKRFIVGNVFGYRATDVRELSDADDPVGPDNMFHIREIVRECDVLVPCWGSRAKLPKRLHEHLDKLLETLIQSQKPVMTFGLTRSGDPKHPLTLSYSTVLVPWRHDGLL